MPSPIAHPAASIPFARAGLVFSALVVGSLAPDFGYVVRMPTPFFMYTLPGLILFDVPVALVLLWLFHALVKWPLLAALPEGLQNRLVKPAQGFSFGPPKHFGVTLLSLLVGALTHVILDSFTHDYGWMVRQFAFLSVSIGGAPLYTILQNLGTILGVGLLAYWFIRWLPAAPRSDQLPARFSGKVRTMFLALAAISFAAVEGVVVYTRVMAGSRIVDGRFFLFSMTISAGFVTALFVGAYCLAWTAAFHRTIRRPG